MILFFLSILCLIILNSLYIYGFFNAGTYKLKMEILTVPEKIRLKHVDPESRHILTGIRLWCENNLGIYLSMPIITCPLCMASLHSIFLYFGAYAAGLLPPELSHHIMLKTFSIPAAVIFYPFYICALSAFNKLAKPALAHE